MSRLSTLRKYKVEDVVKLTPQEMEELSKRMRQQSEAMQQQALEIQRLQAELAK